MLDTEVEKTIVWKNRWSIVPLIVVIVLAILLPSSTWNVLIVTLGGIYLISYLWARELHLHLTGERVLQGGWISVGDHLSESFKLENSSILPALWVELTDYSNIPGYEPSVAYQVNGRSEYKWRQSAVCLQRGRFTIGPWRLRSGDPFGIFEVQIHYRHTEEMIIHPPLNADLTFTLPTGLRQGDVVGRDRAMQVTNNVSAVRNYQPMDPLSWIHWPTTARTGKLSVREFDIEAAGDAWILIDLDQNMHEGSGMESTEEYAVLLASALTTRILARNRAVGLATYGENPSILTSLKGTQQHWRILRTLAELSADGETDLQQGLDDIQQLIKRGSALIVITPNINEDWLPNLLKLSRKQIKTTVVLLDGPSFMEHGSASQTADHMQKTIQQLGPAAEILRRGDIELPNLESTTTDEFKITPLGGRVRATDG